MGWGGDGRAGGINQVTLKFELQVRNGSKFETETGSGLEIGSVAAERVVYQPYEPILMPYVKFSLFDFDHENGGFGAEVRRTPSYHPD